jgi:hypothetical protein
MRKITRQIVSAFMQRKAKSSGNTSTDGTSLRLHSNMIARWSDSNTLEVSLAGWPTVTTRDRLNGIPGVNVYQQKGEQYLNGKLVEDYQDWHTVTETEWRSDTYQCQQVGFSNKGYLGAW